MINQNILQMVQQIKSDPISFLQSKGVSIPSNMTNPNDIIQHLMNTGQVSQERYNQAFQMANSFRNAGK